MEQRKDIMTGIIRILILFIVGSIFLAIAGYILSFVIDIIGRIIVFVLQWAVFGGIAWYGYKYFKKPKPKEKPAEVIPEEAIRLYTSSGQPIVIGNPFRGIFVLGAAGSGKSESIHLLKIAHNVVAIENDTALVEHLRKLFSDTRNVQVVGCDFRNFVVPKFPFKVVSNIPYGITSDIFKILMFEGLENFQGGSIVLQLEPTQKLFSRKLYNPYTVFYHTFFDLKLVYEVGPESFLPPPTVKSALLDIKRKQLIFDFKFKAKYLAFISCLLQKPELSVKTALKSIFRKSQVRSISEKFGLNLNAQIVCLSPSQWKNCFLEMLEVVPEKFHPS